MILRPKNAATAGRILFYDALNRGTKVAALVFNGAGFTFAAGQQGNGFLLNQGYTMVWSGWQGDIPQSGNGGVMGIGFAAVRDLVSFLHYDAADARKTFTNFRFAQPVPWSHRAASRSDSLT